jgi:hypothetical protein
MCRQRVLQLANSRIATCNLLPQALSVALQNANLPVSRRKIALRAPRVDLELFSGAPEFGNLHVARSKLTGELL